jgi:hypothetical protein
MQSLMELPGTTGIAELRQRAEDLTTWKLSLQRGYAYVAFCAAEFSAIYATAVDVALLLRFKKAEQQHFWSVGVQKGCVASVSPLGL